MFLNIVTPCCRPENLLTIAESINIPKENYRWIVVFDLDELPPDLYIPKNCECYLHRNTNSTAGHDQRNFALSLIEKGHIYQNDDDTAIHPDLWNEIKDLDDADLITFSQLDGDLLCVRLPGNEVGVRKTDSHNFIVSYDIAKNIKWQIERYDADGLYAEACLKFAKNHVWIPKVLSIYNWLRIKNL